MSTDASAQALLGGVLVPTSTPQDSFRLAAATPALAICAGQSAAGAMCAEALTRSIGMKLSASGPQTTAAAQVSFVDSWITMPVSFALVGLVAPGSTFSFGRFLDYSFSISDPNSGAGNPLQIFQVNGPDSTIGVSTLTFNGNVSFRNLNQASMPMKALVAKTLSAPQLNTGAIDLHITAVTAIALPEGLAIAAAFPGEGLQLMHRRSAVPRSTTPFSAASGPSCTSTGWP